MQKALETFETSKRSFIWATPASSWATAGTATKFEIQSKWDKIVNLPLSLHGQLSKVDVSYGGENGFNQAIDLSAECLSEVKFIQEKKLMSKYFDEISRGTGL